jgi:signal peptidase
MVMVPLALAAVLVLYLGGSIPYKVYVIHTGSMSPTIPPKSAVLVQEGHYRVGQVVAFRVHDEVVTHRLMAIKPGGVIVTKGDANRSADPWRVLTSSIIGGVVAAPHEVGYLLVYLKTPAGIASILMLILVVLQVGTLARELDEAPLRTA